MKQLSLFCIALLFLSCSKDTSIKNQDERSEDYTGIREFLLTNRFRYFVEESRGGFKFVNIEAHLIFDLNSNLAIQKHKSYFNYNTEFDPSVNCFQTTEIGRGGRMFDQTAGNLFNEDKRFVWRSGLGTMHEIKINSLSKKEKQATFSVYKNQVRGINELQYSRTLEVISDEEYDDFIEGLSGLCKCEAPEECISGQKQLPLSYILLEHKLYAYE